MNIPLVTIITPCYNGEKFLKDYFESILRQTYSNIEVIFVNDGSYDCTERVVQSYSEKMLQRNINFTYLYQENAGQASAMNTAFPYMKGKYLVWPDSDDILTPKSIEERVEFMENNPHYNMIRSNGWYFNDRTGEKLYRISNSDNRYAEDIYLDLILEKTYCACGCYMIRVSEFRKIYPDLKIYESKEGQNWQILIPMAGRNKCAYIDADHYHIRVREESHSRKKRSINEQHQRFLELKNILLKGIQLANRTDRNYQEIAENKYNRILMNFYIQEKRKEDAQIYYNKLKEASDLTDGDQRNYLQCFYQYKYFIYRIRFRIFYVFRKIFKIKEEEK